MGTCDWNIHPIVAYNILHNDILADIDTNTTKEYLVGALSSLGLSIGGDINATKQSFQRYNNYTLHTILNAVKNTNNLINIKNIKNFNSFGGNIDILTYSFPCQSLSTIRTLTKTDKNELGISENSGTKSSLVWNVGRALEQTADKPSFLLLENVPALLDRNNISEATKWFGFLETLGYYTHTYVLNSMNFGVPQSRKRVYAISVLTDKNKDKNKQLDTYFKNNDLSLHREPLQELKDFLRLDYTDPTYLYEAEQCCYNVTKSNIKSSLANPLLINEKGSFLRSYTRTITTNQACTPNAGNLYFKSKQQGKIDFRYLTPRESFLLMGFEESDYGKLLANNFAYNNAGHKFFTRDNLQKMAGNSVVVPVLEAVFKQIIDIDNMILKAT